jgi:hypothetical protein
MILLQFSLQSSRNDFIAIFLVHLQAGVMKHLHSSFLELYTFSTTMSSHFFFFIKAFDRRTEVGSRNYWFLAVRYALIL